MTIHDEMLIGTVSEETIEAPKTVQQAKRSIDETLLVGKNTSDKIRFLDEYGWSRSEIAKFLAVRYQHVRGVLTTPLKKKQA